jgi:chromosome segregation ATPase
VQEYAQTLVKYEEAIAAKDREKVELIESYQSLSDEADRLDSTVQQSLGENSSVRLELATLAQEKANLEDVIQQQATEIQQHIQSLQSYEFQLSNMTAALAKLEGALRQEQEEKVLNSNHVSVFVDH